MKMIFLTREYPPDTLWGGEAIACHDMAHILSDGGHEVHVICQAVNKQLVIVNQKVYVHRVGRNPKRYSVIARIDYSLHALKRLNELMKKYDIDRIEGFYGESGIFLYAFLKFLGVFKKPVILYAHGSIRHAVLDTHSYKGIIGFIATKMLLYLADFTARNSEVVVAISPVIRDELINKSRVNPYKVCLILNPRDARKYRFTRSNIKEKMKLHKHEKLVLAVGRLEMRKGPHILCQAIPFVLKDYPNTKFVFVGSDTPTAPKGESFKEYLLEKAKRERYIDAIVFIEHLPDEELVQLYFASNVVVSASLYEISTSVPIEGMACGKPVVVTDTGNARLLQIDGSNGLIVPPGDPQRLGEAIVKMFALSEEEKIALARKNRKIINKTFSYPRWINEMKRLHEEITS